MGRVSAGVRDSAGPRNRSALSQGKRPVGHRSSWSGAAGAAVPGVKEVRVLGWKSARATVVAEEEATGQALPAAVKGSRAEVGVGSRKALPVSPDRDAAGEGPFNVVVIGAGSAGFAAPIKAAEWTAPHETHLSR